MGFGGPVWHASGLDRTSDLSLQLAYTALGGAGDADAGEWIETGNRVRGRTVMHVRRRPSEAEMLGADITCARDIRGSQEERDRIAALLADAPWLVGAIPSSLLP
jgi:hypothetical protein